MWLGDEFERRYLQQTVTPPATITPWTATKSAILRMLPAVGGREGIE
jgi:hypothetical protein